MSTVALFTVSKRWKEPKCPPADAWVNKWLSVHTVEYDSATKKKEA